MAKAKTPASPPLSRGELATLLNGAKEFPGDLTPRLVLADWLEEHGDPARAEFVRIQCRRVPAEKEELGRREEELLALHANEWLVPFRQAADRSDARLLQRVPRTVQRYLRWRFESGLLRLAIDPESFVHPAVEALAGTEAWAWVEVMLPRGVQGDLGGRLRNSPLWAGLFGVDFEDCKLGPEGAKALAAVRHSRVSIISMSGITRSKHLGQRRWLKRRGC